MRHVGAAARLLLVLAEVPSVEAHGALAVGQKTADGRPLALIANKASEAEATARALRLCQRAFATTERTRRVSCRIELLFQNQCAAVASNREQTAIGWALGATKLEAGVAAELKCEGAPGSGLKCFAHLFECDT